MSLPERTQRTLRAVERRLRGQRALEAFATASLAALPLAALALGLAKTGALDPAAARLGLGVAASVPPLAALLGFAWRLAPLAAARCIDRSHGLHSRMANAVEFDALDAASRSSFMEAALADAEQHVAGVVPSRAAPIRRPRDLAPAAAAFALTLVLAALELPATVPVLASAATVDALLAPDDLQAFEAELEAMAREPGTTEELRLLAGEMNALLEAMADRELDRTQALRRIAELENRLAEGRPADAEAMAEGLRELGRKLESASLTRPASEALRNADAARAEQEMRELSEVLRESAPSRADLDRLRQALERASQDEAQDLRSRLEREREEVSRLLRRQQEQSLSEPEQRLLRRRQRELERLERQHQDVEAQRRQLERLRRDLERAAEDLNRERRDQAAEDLQRAAEDLNRMAREQMSEEQRRELEQQLRQLREMIRRQQQQQGQDGQGQGGGGGRDQRMQRFVLRASGQGEAGGYRLLMPGQQGQQGSEGPPGPEGQPGQPGPGQPGQGQGQPGQGPGQGQGEGQRTLTLGQGGDATLEIPGMGEPGPRGGEGEGRSEQGPGAGTEHDPLTLDDPTQLRSRTTDSRVEGQHADGPSRSETILGAADRGFVSRDYGEVYTDYRDHAEEVLERDEVPQGYRFYVRRYFQLIRPREEPNE